MIYKLHFWIYIQRKLKQDIPDICTPMFIAALFTIAKIILVNCIGGQWIVLSIDRHWIKGERRCMCVIHI